MFQRLYRHLELISEGLQKSRHNMSATSEQLELINKNLSAINSAIVVQQRKSPTTWLQVTNGCILLVMIIFLCIYMTHINDRDKPTLVQAAQPTVSPENKLHVIDEKIVQSETHLQKLDSLINVQEQSLKELTHLNRMAVRTFQHIGRRLDAVTGPVQNKASLTPELANQP